MLTRAADKITSQLQPGRFGRHLSINLAQTIVESGCLTVAVLIVARLFGPALFGFLGLFLVGIQLVTMILEGMWISQVKAVAENSTSDRYRAHIIGWRSVGFCIVAGVVLGIFVVAGYAAYDFSFIGENPGLVFLTIATAITRVSKSSFEAVCRGLHDFALPARWAIALAPLQMIALIAAAWRGYEIGAYLGIMAAFQAVNTIGMAIEFYHRYIHPIPAHEMPATTGTVKAIFNYSIPLMGRGFVAFVLLKTNIPLIAALAGETELGYYRLAEQFYMLALLVVGAIINALAPRIAGHLARGEKDQVEWIVSKTYGLLLLLLLPMTLFFAINDPVINLLFPDYSPATGIIRCFAALLIIRGFSFVSTGALLTQGGYPGTAMLLATFGAVFNVVAVWLLVPLFGALGAAIGTVCVHIVMSLLMIVTGHILLGIRFRVRFL